MDQFTSVATVVSADQVNVVIISKLSDQYEMGRRMLDSEMHLTRERIDRCTPQKYERLQAQRERSRASALTATTRRLDIKVVCQLHTQQGHAAPQCTLLKVTVYLVASEVT